MLQKVKNFKIMLKISGWKLYDMKTNNFGKISDNGEDIVKYYFFNFNCREYIFNVPCLL